jgi:hypothetical protein
VLGALKIKELFVFSGCCIDKHAHVTTEGVLSMLRCWRILVSLKLLGGFKDVLSTLEKLVATLEMIQWRPAAERLLCLTVEAILRHFHRCCYRSSPLWFFYWREI